MPNAKYKILVIDDCQQTRNRLQTIFDEKKHQLFYASTAHEGLELSKSQQPDVILLEIAISAGDGFWFLHRLVAEPSIAEIAVIILTRVNDAEKKRASLELGATDYIAKPFNDDELYTRIRVILRHQEHLQRLTQRGHIDLKTTLWNHEHFKCRFQEEVTLFVRHKRNFSILLMRIDDFENSKQNPDLILKMMNIFGGLIWNNCRTCDIPSHCQENLFTMILPETSAIQAAQTAQRIRAIVSMEKLKSKELEQYFTITAVLISSDIFPFNANSSLLDSLFAAGRKFLQIVHKETKNQVLKPSFQELAVQDEKLKTHQPEKPGFQALGSCQSGTSAPLQDQEIRDLLETILQHMVDLLNTQHAFVFLVEPNHDTAKCVFALGVFAEILDLTISIGDDQHIGCIQDITTLNESSQCDEWLPASLQGKVHAMIANPLRSKDSSIGVIGVAYDKTSCVQFDQQKTTLFLRVAELSATIFEHVSAYSCAKQDAIEGRALKEELTKIKRLGEQMSRNNCRMLANMSHELRTPLNAIIGYSDLLFEDVQNLGEMEMADDIGKVKDSALFLLTLVNNVLDFTKLNAGKTTLYLERLSIIPLVDMVVDSIYPMTKRNNLELKVNIDPAIEEVYSDHIKLKQILLNLLSNAVKFTEQGTVTLSIKRFDDGYSVESKLLQIAVTDTGIGIDKNHLCHLFQPFTQADASSTRKYGGTGLGLAIIRSFCKMLGGSITVDSTLGKGSTFTVKLPIETENSLEKLVLMSDPKRKEVPLSLMVVGVSSIVTEAKLDTEWDQILYVANLIEALGAMENQQPDVIVMDVDGPACKDFEFYRVLKTNEKSASIPIVFIGKQGDSINLIRGLDAGGFDFITRPFEPEELRARIRVALRHKKELDQLKIRSQVDGLTALWNEKHFQTRIQGELAIARRYQRPFAILLVVVDSWDEVRQKHGLQACKLTLEMISKSILDFCRAGDVPCKWNRDGFGILLPYANQEEAILYTRQLRKKVLNRLAEEEEPYRYFEVVFSMVTSDYFKPVPDADTDKIIAMLQQTLVRAKREGKNQIYIIGTSEVIQ